jgi:hypothetical protein
MLKKIDIRESQKLFPYFIYKRLELASPREYFFYKLDYGFGYFLRRMVARWPSIITPPHSSPTTVNDLYFEFFDKSKKISRQIEPIPGNLLTTPGRDGTAKAESKPVDKDIFGVNFPASAPKSFKLLNLFYMYGNQIEIQITGQANAAVAGNKFYLDLLLCGYYLQEDSLALWNEGV